MANLSAKQGLRDIQDRQDTEIRTSKHQVSNWNKEANGWGIANSAANAGLGIGTALAATNPAGWVVLGASALVSLWSGIEKNDASNHALAWEQRADAMTSAQTNYASYQKALEERDIVIAKTKQNLNSKIETMKRNYGEAFTNSILDLYFKVNGIDPSKDVSFLAGNYQVFDRKLVGSGTEATFQETGEYTGIDSILASGELFRTDLAGLSMDDINSISDLLTHNLMNDKNSVYGIQFQQYEQEVGYAISDYVKAELNSITDSSLKLQSLGAEKLVSDIQNAEGLGSAEAKRGTSGLRGGTTSNNELIQKLNSDIAQMRYSLQVASYVSNFYQNLDNIQINTLRTIQAQRTNEKILDMQAKIGAGDITTDFSEIENEGGISGNELARTADKYRTAGDSDAEFYYSITD